MAIDDQEPTVESSSDDRGTNDVRNEADRDVAVYVSRLVFGLRAQGFVVDTRQAIAIERMLISLAPSWQRSDFDLARHIGPVLCRNVDEQRRFRTIIDRLGWPDEKPSRELNESGQSPDDDSRPNTAKNKLWWLISGSVALVLIVMAVNFIPTSKPIEPQEPTTQPKKKTSDTTVEKDSQNAVESSDNRPDRAHEEPARLLSYHRVMLREPLKHPATSSWIWASLPLVLFSGWYLYHRSKRPRLRRESSELEPVLSEVQLPGSPSQPFAELRMKEVGRSLRIRQRIASRELNTELTIQRTLANGGLLTPVFESTVEPRYLVLIDQASKQDHFGKLAQALISTLQSGNVDCVVFEFDRNPTYCNIPLNQRARGDRFRFHFNEILDQQPDRPLMIFSDGARFINPVTNVEPDWFQWVSDRPRVLVTPADPQADWTQREVQLRRSGFQVVPMTPHGIPEIAKVLSGHESSRRSTARRPLSFEIESERCLSRIEPPVEFIDSLCHELRDHLGPDGFLWIAALAAYPEIHWGLSLRLGASLLTADSWQSLLPRLTRLVWLRHGYMPDWLRQALLSRISKNDERRIRQILINFLAQSRHAIKSAGNMAAFDVPLTIVVDEPKSVWGRMAQWLKNWHAVRSSLFESWPSRLKAWWMRSKKLERRRKERFDHVYLRFLSGNGPNWLTQLVPEQLVRLLFPKGWMFGPSVGLVAGALMCCAFGVLVFNETIRSLRFEVNSLSVGKSGQQIFTKHVSGMQASWVTRPVLLWTLAGHSKPILHVDYSSNGQYIATASLDTIALVWDATTGRQLHKLQHDGGVQHVVFSSNSQRIVTSDDSGAAHLWDPKTGDKLHTFKHVGAVYDAAFSPDSQYVATASHDHTARVWNAQTGTMQHALQHDAEVDTVSFSSDGRRILTASQDKTARIWNFGTGKELFRLKHDNAVIEAEFSPDDTQVLTHTEDSSNHLWNTDTGLPETAQIAVDARGEVVQAVGSQKPVLSSNGVYASDGLSFATSEYGTASIWDKKSGKLIRSLAMENRNIFPIKCYSPDNSCMALSPENSLNIYHWRDGQLIHVLDNQRGAGSDSVSSMCYSPDGKRLVAAFGSGVVDVWQVATEVFDLQSSSTATSVMPTAHDSYRLARESSGNLAVYRIGATSPVIQVSAKNVGSIQAISNDGTELAVVAPNVTTFYPLAGPKRRLGVNVTAVKEGIRIESIDKDSPLLMMKDNLNVVSAVEAGDVIKRINGQRITGLAMLQEQLAKANADGRITVTIQDARSGSELEWNVQVLTDSTHKVVPTAISEPIGGTWVHNNRFILWDKLGHACTVSSGTESVEFSIPTDVTNHLPSPDGKWLALWQKGGAINLVDVSRSATSIGLAGIKLADAIFSSNSQFLLVWDQENVLSVYATDHRVSSQKVKTASGALGTIKVNGSLRSACISQSGETVATLLNDGTLVFQSLTIPNSLPQEPLRVPMKDVQHVAQGDHDVLAVVFKDGKVRLFDAESGASISDALPASGPVKLAAFSPPALADQTDGASVKPGTENSSATDEKPADPKAGPPTTEPKSEVQPTYDKPTYDKPAEKSGSEPPPKADQGSATKKQASTQDLQAGNSSVWLTAYTERPEDPLLQKQNSPANVQQNVPTKNEKPLNLADPQNLLAPREQLEPREQLGPATSTSSTPLTKARRQSLALTIEFGNIEMWEIGNAGRGYALVISSGRAPNADVPAAVSLGNTLRQRYGFMVTSLQGPSREMVNRELERLKSNLNPSDRLIVLVSTLEKPTITPDSLLGLGAGNEQVSLNELRTFLNETWAGQKLLVLDIPDANATLAAVKPINTANTAGGPTLVLQDRQSLKGDEFFQREWLRQLDVELKRKSEAFHTDDMDITVEFDTKDLNRPTLKPQYRFYFPGPRSAQ